MSEIGPCAAAKYKGADVPCNRDGVALGEDSKPRCKMHSRQRQPRLITRGMMTRIAVEDAYNHAIRIVQEAFHASDYPQSSTITGQLIKRRDALK